MKILPSLFHVEGSPGTFQQPLFSLSSISVVPFCAVQVSLTEVMGTFSPQSLVATASSELLEHCSKLSVNISPGMMLGGWDSSHPVVQTAPRSCKDEEICYYIYTFLKQNRFWMCYIYLRMPSPRRFLCQRWRLCFVWHTSNNFYWTSSQVALKVWLPQPWSRQWSVQF